jgi:hypothetical protein
LAGFKRHLALFAAICTDRRIHLAVFPVGIPLGATLIAALLAALRLIIEPPLRVEFLLPGCENELPPALLAG